MARDREEQRRPIRSFVRRAGRMTSSQQRALEQFWPQFGIEFEHALLDFPELFGRDAPVVLEIGFGNGDTLVRQASADPDSNYVGIEVHAPGVGHCLIAAQKAGINNLRLVSHDAVEVLREQIPLSSLRRINLYFPDPWPKKRHHKRRIVQPPFLLLCADRLEPGGSLHIATDWADYAGQIDELLGICESFVCTERREHEGDRPLDRPITKFERRGRELGHHIWDWRFERVPESKA